MTTILIIALIFAGIALLAAVAYSASKTKASDQQIAEMERRLAEQESQGEENLERQMELMLGKFAEKIAGGQEVLKEKFDSKFDNNRSLLETSLKPLQEGLKTQGESIENLLKETKTNDGTIANQLNSLSHTSQNMRTEFKQLIGNFQERGNWGERLAEDILKSAGFISDISYFYQKDIVNPGDSTKALTPDFTFSLPDGGLLYMDVKFPFANYKKALDLEAEARVPNLDEVTRKSKLVESEAAAKDFVKDAKGHIDDLRKKGYVDSKNSLDQMLMFIPNDSALDFLVTKDAGIVDYGLAKNITLCSPMSLFTILAIVRQSARTLKLRESSDEILKEHTKFRDQWGRFKEELSKLGRKIGETQKIYDHISTTRTNQLEKPIQKIEKIEAIKSEENPGLRQVSSGQPSLDRELGQEPGQEPDRAVVPELTSGELQYEQDIDPGTEIDNSNWDGIQDDGDTNTIRGVA